MSWKTSLFDRLYGADPNDPYAPNEAVKRRSINQGLLQLGAGLLGTGGGFGNALGAGIQNGLLAVNNRADSAEQQAYKRQIMERSANGGAAFQALDMQAKAAGYQPGTPEYQHFMRVQGGIEGRASSAGATTFVQDDENGIPTRYTFNPRTMQYDKARINAPPVDPNTGIPQRAPGEVPFSIDPTLPPELQAAIRGNESLFANAPEVQIDRTGDSRVPPPAAPRPSMAPPPPSVQQPPNALPPRLDPVNGGLLGTPIVGRSKEAEAAAVERAKQQVEQSGYAAAAQQAARIEAAKANAQAQAAASNAPLTAGAEATVEAAKGQAKDAAAAYTTIQNKGMVARGDNNKLIALQDALQNTYTGTGAKQVLGLKKAAAAFNIKTDGLGPGQMAEALSNRLALSLRNPAGGEGMPGSMSNQDRAFLQASVPSLQNTPDGWKQMIDMQIKLNQAAIDQQKEATRLRRAGVPIQDIPERMQDYADKHPVFDTGKPKLDALSDDELLKQLSGQ